MDSPVLEQLRQSMPDMHPRAKEIYNFLCGYFTRENNRIQCSGFVKESAKCMSGSEARLLFDWLTGSAEYLLLSDGARNKFSVNSRSPLTMTALNNIMKLIGFSETYIPRDVTSTPVSKPQVRTVYKVISLSDFDTSDLKAELARRERKAAEERALNEKRTRLLTIRKKLLTAANAIGLHTKEDLIDLINEAFKLENEIKDR